MNALKSIQTTLAGFLREEDGAQVVEYALVIALVSIALALTLSKAFTAAGGPFSQLITRIGACMTGPTCT